MAEVSAGAAVKLFFKRSWQLKERQSWSEGTAKPSGEWSRCLARPNAMAMVKRAPSYTTLLKPTLLKPASPASLSPLPPAPSHPILPFFVIFKNGAALRQQAGNDKLVRRVG